MVRSEAVPKHQAARFSPGEHARIAEAIRQAEAATTGEIFAVSAQASGGYFFVAAAGVLFLALLAGAATAFVATLAGLPINGAALEAGQFLFSLAALAALAAIPPLRLLFVPRHIRADRAHRLAVAQFKAHNMEATEQRTGILIFVSRLERHAEIVADAGIAAKVRQEDWDAIVDALTETAARDDLANGFVAAVEAAGRLLCRHFPATGRNPNEIPDRLVEIGHRGL